MTSQVQPPSPASGPTPRSSLIAVVTGAGTEFVGVVNGNVTIESSHHRFWGGRVLSGCVLFTAAVIGLRFLFAGATLAGLLFGPVLVLVALLLIYRLLLGAWLGRAIRAAAIGIVRAVASAGRALVKTAAGRLGVTPPEQTLIVRRFQVRTATGQIRTCVLLGDLIGDDLRSGDYVRVTGRNWRRQCLVREADILSSPGGPVVRRVSARPPGSYRLARWVSRFGYVLAALLLLWTVSDVAGTLSG